MDQPTTKTAIKYDLEVNDEGRLELEVPYPPGTPVTVFVIGEEAVYFDDLLFAAESSIDFWDNPYDDEDWNNA